VRWLRGLFVFEPNEYGILLKKIPCKMTTIQGSSL
jgi:hypothetical protein